MFTNVLEEIYKHTHMQQKIYKHAHIHSYTHTHTHTENGLKVSAPTAAEIVLVCERTLQQRRLLATSRYYYDYDYDYDDDYDYDY